MGRYWSTVEVEILRKHYPVGGVEACRALLSDRSPSSIHNQAQRLGCTAPAYRPPVKRIRYESSDYLDEQIRLVYAKEGSFRGEIQRLSDRIGRSKDWIRRRAEALGVTRNREKPQNWSKEELAVLDERISEGADAIYRALRRSGFVRSKSSILNQIRRQGLSMDVATDVYSGNELCRLFGVHHLKVRNWIALFGLKAVRNRGEKTHYQVRRKDLRSWVINNVEHVNFATVDKHWLTDLLAGR